MITELVTARIDWSKKDLVRQEAKSTAGAYALAADRMAGQTDWWSPADN